MPAAAKAEAAEAAASGGQPAQALVSRTELDKDEQEAAANMDIAYIDLYHTILKDAMCM